MRSDDCHCGEQRHERDDLYCHAHWLERYLHGRGQDRHGLHRRQRQGLLFPRQGRQRLYDIGSGKDFYFLAKVDSGYTITNVTNAAAVEGYDGLYKIANVTGNTTVTLTTAEAPKAEYSFEVRTENGTQVAYIKGYLGEGGDNGTITLPTSATVNGKDYPVVGVAERAFNVSNGSVDGVKSGDSLAKIKKTSGSKLNGASGTLTIPETVTITKADTDFTFTIIGIGEKALYQYENGYSSSDYWFAEVKFPSTLQYIGKWGCSALAGVTEIDLSNTKVTSIGSFAFNNCGNLATVKLPATLTTFGGETKTESKENANQTGNDTNTGDYDGGSESNKKFDEKQEESVSYTENVFMGCQSLQNILVAADNPSFKDVDGVLFTKDGKTLVRYPVGKPATSYAIPDGTETIEECAFMQTATGMQQKPGKLQTVTFPRSLKQIKSGAFRQTSLTSVQLPANVTFGSYIFDCSKSLTTVTTENGVTEIPVKAFWGCENVTTVTLVDSVKTIGESAFERAGFTSIDLNKVTTIGKYAFYFSKLTSVTVPAAAECGTGAFMNCADLTTATVNGTKLDRHMFWYCTDLTTLTAPNVTEIDECALGYCVKLTSLPLAKVTSIGHGAFRNCHGLTAVTIPGSVQSFGKYVFADCGNLSSVTFVGNANVTSLPEMRINSRNRKKMTKGARREIVRCEQTDRTLLRDLSSQ